MTDIIRTDLVLSQSAFSHIVNVPIEQIDIGKGCSTFPKPSTNVARRLTIFPAARRGPMMAAPCRPT